MCANFFTLSDNRKRIKKEKDAKKFTQIKSNIIKKKLPFKLTKSQENVLEEINLDLSKVGKNKFFYDVIYNPKETNFLKIGKKMGNGTENGKLMFIYQAFIAFKIWHEVEPEINNEVIKLLDWWLKLEF